MQEMKEPCESGKSKTTGRFRFRRREEREGEVLFSRSSHFRAEE